MKKLIVIIFLIFLSKNNYSQWSTYELPEFSGNSYSMDFSNKNGIACGFYYDGNKLNGTILYTTNSGVSWLKSIVPNLSRAFYNVKFTTNSNAYICGEFYQNAPILSNACLLKTTNAGINWNIINNDLGYSKYKFIEFINDTIGYSIGLKYNLKEDLIKTTNGGITWEIIYSGNIIFSSMNLNFKDLYFCGNEGQIGKIITLKNNSIDSVIIAQNFIRNISFSDKNIGLLLCYSYPTFNNNVSIYKTTNSGLNWNIIQNFNNYQFNNIKFLKNTSYALLYGNDEYDSVSLFATFNYGEQWVEKSPNNISTNQVLNDCYIFNKDDIILLCGDYYSNGLVLKAKNILNITSKYENF